MKDCEKVKDLLPDFAYNEIEKSEKDFVNSHLEKCAGCKAELEAIKKVIGAAGDIKAKLPDHMWEMHLKAVMKGLESKAPARIHIKLWGWLDVRAFATAMALFVMLAAGAVGYFSFTKKAFPGHGREIEMAENLDMIENMEIIERLEFYKNMTEKLCEKEPC